ncbi:MAG: glycosyltransferase family 4 protein [Rubrobacteraceae bacterium]
MRPRVLFLDHTGSLGGAELFLLDIARDNLGTSQVVLFADGPFRERLEESGVEVKLFPAPEAVSGISREGGLKRDLLAVPGVLDLARRVAKLARDYEVIYANSQKALFIGALAGKIAGKPVIWHQHDLLTADHFSRGHRRLSVLLSNHLISRVITCSKAAAKALVEGGGHTEAIRVVYNGIDATPFESVTQAEVDELRRELDLEGVPVVGVFSRLAPWKGQDVLLEALPYLPDVHVLLVGEAIFGEQEYAESLRRRSKDLGVEDRVHFAGFRRDIPQLMCLSDVITHTSVSPEPFGRVIVEGMLARSPVVATRAGGTVEIVDDEVSGILVPPGDPEALAKALSDLLDNPDKARELAEAGRVVALERFSLQGMLDGVAQQLQEVAAWRR